MKTDKTNGGLGPFEIIWIRIKILLHFCSEIPKERKPCYKAHLKFFSLMTDRDEGLNEYLTGSKDQCSGAVTF
jgi:hypothetical protein